MLIRRKVQGEAQGDEEPINKLLEDISRGPRHAEVTKLEKSEIDPKVGESRFQVVRSLQHLELRASLIPLEPSRVFGVVDVEVSERTV
ncbi:acylphosphatase [Emydomyces testavorans]|uniref:Acylphosphatase n=1 Tax=Emydomyces testavorans TaxID=2070801 RepID=A0AAF0IIT9_9EURO|nr:acylphosphatase [Emydomyces testavorans]